MRQDNEATGFRIIRLQELMLEELRGLLRDDVTDPALAGIVITALVLSVDYRHARVHFAVHAQSGDTARQRAAALRGFARATPFFRARLTDAIELKRIPDLRFVFDAVAAEEVPR